MLIKEVMVEADFDLILISQSAMPFFPGREHIYSIHINIQKWQHTYTTEQLQHKYAEKLLHTQINYKNSCKNRSSLKVAEVKMSIGTAFHQWMIL